MKNLKNALLLTLGLGLAQPAISNNDPNLLTNDQRLKLSEKLLDQEARLSKRYSNIINDFHRVVSTYALDNGKIEVNEDLDRWNAPKNTYSVTLENPSGGQITLSLGDYGFPGNNEDYQQSNGEYDYFDNLNVEFCPDNTGCFGNKTLELILREGKLSTHVTGQIQIPDFDYIGEEIVRAIGADMEKHLTEDIDKRGNNMRIVIEDYFFTVASLIFINQTDSLTDK